MPTDLDNSLWPPECPACHYSWQGLPHPRCPECGESIAPDEILLTGEPVITRTAFYLRGTPHHVLRLSPRGFQLGTLDRKGPLYPWTNTRLEILATNLGNLHVMAFRIFAGYRAWLIFDFRINRSPQFMNSFIRALESANLPHFSSNISLLNPHQDFLIPTRCPLCRYSWEGLPQPRCPECGETVEPGEIVLVTDPLLKQQPGLTGENWSREALETLMFVIFGGFMLLLLHGPGILVFMIPLGMGIIFLLMISIMALRHKRRGLPAGILRLSQTGFQIGAGTRKGPIFPWSPRFRIEVSYDSYRPLQIKILRMLGTLPLWPVFHLKLHCSPIFAKSLFAQLNHWQTQNVVIKQGTGT